MSVKQSHELKALTTRMAVADAEFKAARAEAADAQRKVSACQKRRDDLAAQIAKMNETRKDIMVTEHAILRYIERAYGIDLQEITDRMLSPDVRAIIDQFGSGKVPCEGGRLVVRDRTVITVETAN